MSVVGHQPPPFFKRGPAPLARLAFFVILSLVLLVLDLKYRYLELARQGVATVLYPLQRAAYTPVDLYEQLGGYFSSLAAVQRENVELKRKELESAKWLLRQQHLELENQRLRQLLDMKARQPVTSTLADILHAARDPFSRRVMVDKGSQHGIVAGQAVVDEAGVLGQVTRVYPLQSEVTLVTDKNQAVPVQVVRNGLRTVLFGASDGQLELRFLAANADIQPGDQLVTSGLDGVYLAGLPVAKVLRVDRDAAYTFARIVCEPAAGVEKHGQVLILGLREALQRQVEETEARDRPVKPKRSRRRDG
ncbi:MAG: rod shape-determining protein MreC [Rhodocyclaceae bacterium]|nr:rod shape-determining protein MreC [Rhodocyclaceae bacterium]